MTAGASSAASSLAVSEAPLSCPLPSLFPLSLAPCPLRSPVPVLRPVVPRPRLLAAGCGVQLIRGVNLRPALFWCRPARSHCCGSQPWCQDGLGSLWTPASIQASAPCQASSAMLSDTFRLTLCTCSSTSRESTQVVQRSHLGSRHFWWRRTAQCAM